MVDALLLIVAIALTAVLFLPFLLIQSIRRRHDLSSYYFNLAKNIDYVWCSLIFAEDGHTISAICYKRLVEGKNIKYLYAVRAINWLFNDERHCFDSYVHEFKS